MENHNPLAERFRGFLPVVIDVETGGFNKDTDALLEIAAVTLTMDEDGWLMPDETICTAVHPFDGANIEQAALDITGINPDDPLRGAIEESEALNLVFQKVRKAVKSADCKRAVMVAHNAHFDLGFVNKAAERCDSKRNPFHPFTCFDTATLAGLAYGQTVLAKACEAASIEFNSKEAHSAAYDAERTADLYCGIVNCWRELGGWLV